MHPVKRHDAFKKRLNRYNNGGPQLVSNNPNPSSARSYDPEVYEMTSKAMEGYEDRFDPGDLPFDQWRSAEEEWAKGRDMRRGQQQMQYMNEIQDYLDFTNSLKSIQEEEDSDYMRNLPLEEYYDAKLKEAEQLDWYDKSSGRAQDMGVNDPVFLALSLGTGLSSAASHSGLTNASREVVKNAAKGAVRTAAGRASTGATRESLKALSPAVLAAIRHFAPEAAFIAAKKTVPSNDFQRND